MEESNSTTSPGRLVLVVQMCIDHLVDFNQTAVKSGRSVELDGNALQARGNNQVRGVRKRTALTIGPLRA